MEQEKFPETLLGAVRFFADADRAFEFVRSIRWPDGIAKCPCCGSDKTSFLSTRKVWKCMPCKKQFSVRVGTIFEDSPLGFDKWLPAFWLVMNSKNGISSCEIARSLGVTQKTAWFMLHRIRLAIQDETIISIGGHVEADETYIGGKARNMHPAKRREKITGTGGSGKTAVMGLLERTNKDRASRVVLKVVETTRKTELQGQVRKYVLKGSEVHTDALKSYEGLKNEYTHNVIDHAECYVRGHVHTNGLENFWSLLKRSIKGTYVSVEPFHLFRYLDEQAFRFNERKDTDQGRFLKGIIGIVGKGLRYSKLIGAGQNPPEETGNAWATA